MAPMLITPQSELGKELAKWEQPNYSPAAHPFPKMLYQAHRRPDGVVSVGEVDDSALGKQPGIAEAFNRRCQLEVHSEVELSQAVERGWSTSPDEALERFERDQKRKADAAAHRAFEDRHMTDAAKREAAEAEEATEEHVAEVPEKKRARRGRPRKRG